MRVISAADLERAGQYRPAGYAAQCSYRTRCQIAGITLELRTDVPELPEQFLHYYFDHRSEAAPDLRFYVCRDERGYAFWSDESPAFRWIDGALPPDALMFLTDACAMSALVAFDASLVSMHAAAIEAGGRAAAILGNSTAGKTTTLLACARAGMGVYSDERALVRAGIVQPFLRRLSVRADGARRLLADAGDDALARVLECDSQFTIASAFGAQAIAAPQRLDTLFVLAGYAERPVIERAEPAAAVNAMMPWFDAAGNAFERIRTALDIAKSCNCFRLQLGTPAATAAAIRDVLTEDSRAAAS